MQSIRQQVREFMQAADQSTHDHPRRPTNRNIRLHLRLIAEEFQELLSAIYTDIQDDNLETIRETLGSMLADDQDPYDDIDLTLVADCFADIAYVVEGANQVFGFNSTRVGAEVHAANMRKFAEGGWRRADGKYMKPPNWVGPDIAGALDAQNIFQPARRFGGEYLIYHHRGFEVRFVNMDNMLHDMFSEKRPACAHSELVNNIIDHAHQPIDHIQVGMYWVFVQYKNRSEIALYEVP